MAASVERYLTERQRFVLNDGLSVEAVVNAMAGLSLVHVEDILLRTKEECVLSKDFIWEHKQSILDPRIGIFPIEGSWTKLYSECGHTK